MVANTLRDTLSAWVTTGQKGFIPMVDTAKGFVKALRNDPKLGINHGVRRWFGRLLPHRARGRAQAIESKDERG